MSIKHELQNIISGNGSVRNGKIIQTITDYLRREKKAISATEETKFSKDQETEVLVKFITHSNLWYSNIDSSKYIGEGAEQRVYEFSDPNYILKLNDSIFYAYWEDYFNSLLLHNYFFPHLAYELLGFIATEAKLGNGAKNSWCFFVKLFLYSFRRSEEEVSSAGVHLTSNRIYHEK